MISLVTGHWSVAVSRDKHHTSDAQSHALESSIHLKIRINSILETAVKLNIATLKGLHQEESNFIVFAILAALMILAVVVGMLPSHL